MSKLFKIAELAKILVNQPHFSEILRLSGNIISQIIKAKSVLILVINPQTRETIKTVFQEGKIKKDDLFREIRIHISGWVLNEKRPILIKNIQADARFNAALFRGIPVKSIVAAPLKLDGNTIGVLIAANPLSRNAFDSEDLSLLETSAAIISPYLRNARQLHQFFEAPVPKTALLKKYQAFGMYGKSQPFIELLQNIEIAAQNDANVLMEGRTGTGKELVAHAIHKLSRRKDRSFIAIDCGAIPLNLIESELFGHVKGAFTGANRDRKGLFAEADGGTLFMDEIANLPLEMQAKLMRALQSGEIRPLGSNRIERVDVRIISASTSSLVEMMAERTFREDLYYRLMIFPIYMPSLNDRRADIPLLANHFLKKLTAKKGKTNIHFSAPLLQFMKQRDWNGNIRELENFVAQLAAYANAGTPKITFENLPPNLKKEAETFRDSQNTAKKNIPLNERLKSFEKTLLIEQLEANNWHQTNTAKRLGIPEQTLRFKMKKLGIIRPS